LFASGESRPYPSAKRMNMNSRGRQPTERRAETDSTLKGSHHRNTATHIPHPDASIVRSIVRPFQGR
jgi:hypothetical protein